MAMLPPRGMPPGAGGPPPGVGGMTPPPPILQAIMKMLPPQVVQAIAQNPAIIPQLIQRFLPMVLGAMGGGGAPGGGGVPPGAAGPPMPPRRPVPPQFAARRQPIPPGAFSGNSPPQPSSQGAIQPQSTEEELAEASQNMGKKRGGY